MRFRKESNKSLHQKYVSVSALWKQLLNEASSYSINYDDITSESILLSQTKDSSLQTKQTIEKFFKNLRSDIKIKNDAVSDQYYTLFDKVSNYRGDLLNDITILKGKTFFSLFLYWSDIYYELIAIPSRFLNFTRTKSQDIRAKLDLGFPGYLELLWDSFLFIISLFVPFIAIFLFRKLAEIQTDFKKQLWRKRDLRSTIFASINQKSSPYLGWLVGYATLEAISQFWIDSIFEEGLSILPLAFFYIHYRIARKRPIIQRIYLDGV